MDAAPSLSRGGDQRYDDAGKPLRSQFYGGRQGHQGSMT